MERYDVIALMLMVAFQIALAIIVFTYFCFKAVRKKEAITGRAVKGFATYFKSVLISIVLVIALVSIRVEVKGMVLYCLTLIAPVIFVVYYFTRLRKRT